LDQTGGNISVVGGAGNDTVVIASDMLTYQDTISGGDDTDTLELTYDANATSLAYSKASTGAFRNVDVEKIQLTGATALTITIADAGLASLGTTYFTASGADAHAVDASGILGGGGTVKFDASASTMTGAAVYTGGSANDHFIGGSGANTVTYSNGVYLTASDTLVGGAGDDILSIDSDNAVTLTAAALANVSGFNLIRLDDTAADVDSTAMAITVSEAFAEANKVSGNSTLHIARDKGSLSGTTYTAGTPDDTGTTTVTATDVTVKLKIMTADGADTVTGGSNSDYISTYGGADSITAGAGNDTILGGAAADTIYAGDGNDSITGGLGIDRIYLGDGTDRVVFNDDTLSSNQSVVSGFTLYGAVDTVTGASGYDIVEIDESEFASIDFSGGTGIVLASADYVEIASGGTLVDDSINVVIGTGYAGLAAFHTAETEVDGEYFFMFYNTNTQSAELYYTADGNAGSTLNTHEILVAQFTGLTLADMESWSYKNFYIAA